MRKIRTKLERDAILKSILKQYPAKQIELNYETPFQLLIAVMLSAQMTDKGVNKATKQLFAKVQTPKDLLLLKQSEVQEMLRGINYYRTKTAHIFETAKILITQFDEEIPKTIPELMQLKGVGIKTAKVIASHLYGVPTIGVDTHIHRVMNRMGIVSTKTPKDTDKKLDALLTNTQKRDMHHALVLFGRYVCTARKCHCPETPLAKWCTCKQCLSTKKE